MRLEENWAVETGRMRAFLQQQADVSEESGVFHYKSCAISLLPLQASVFGKWPLPRTQLVFEGCDADVLVIRRRVFLRFLSAGG